MPTLDELVVAIGMETGDLTRDVAAVADDVERGLADVDGTAAGADVGADFIDAIASAVTSGDLDGEVRQLLADVDNQAAAAGQDAGDALADGIADGAQQGAQEAERSLGQMDLTAAGAAAGAVFVAGLQSAMDIGGAETRLRNQLGLTQQEAQRAGTVAGDVFAAGFGESMDEVSTAVAGVASNVGDLGSASNAELEGMTQAALGLARTFDWDIAEATQAAGSLLRSGLAADGTEAFDLLTAGAQRLPLAMQAELPAVVAEYTEFFDQLGVTGPQMMGVLATAAENPLFQIDRLGDAVKEFTLIMAEGAEGTADAVEDLGLDLEDLQALINTGRGAEAFDQVSQALAGVEEQSERTRLQAELMGGPGEDVANSLMAVAEAGGLAGTGLEGAAGASAALTDAMEDDPAQQFTSSMRTLQTELGTALLPVITAVAGFLSEHQSTIQALAPVVLMLAVAMGILTVAQWAYNAALFASGIPAIIALVALLVGGIIYLATQTTFFQDIWTASWEWIQGAAAGVWDWLSTWWPLLFGILFGPFGLAAGAIIIFWDDITGAAARAYGWIEDRTAEAVGWVTARWEELSGLPGRIVGWFSNLGSDLGGTIADGFRSAINSVISGWNSISFSIPGYDWPGPGSFGGITIGVPPVPMLAEGGIATGPTFAMVGEGSESEAILPLSRLDSMLNSVQPAVRSVGGTQRMVGVLEVRGDGGVAELIRHATRTRGGDPSIVFRGE